MGHAHSNHKRGSRRRHEVLEERFAGIIVWIPIILLILGMLLLASCSSEAPKVYAPGSLADTILVFRKNYTGLTYGNCKSYEKEKCSGFEVKVFDLTDESIRKQLRDLNFICKLGDKRYKISSDRPGLVQRSYIYKKFLGITFDKTAVDDYISQGEVDRLVNAGAVCFSEDSYPFQDM